MFPKFFRPQAVPRWSNFFLTGVLILTGSYSIFLPSVYKPPEDAQPTFPIRAAFYYPWFPQAWTQQGIYPFTNYTPSLGFYNGSELNIVQKHIAAMQYGGIQAGIASWWGVGTHTDGRIAILLQAAASTPFRWALYHEQESQGNPTVSELRADLTYIRDNYAGSPGFLRVDGRFVVFVYADDQDGCGMADRWKQANTVGAYLVLKVFPGYRQCASQPDSWHQYSPAVAEDNQAPYSFAISPGFWLKGQNVRLGRNLATWQQNVRNMVASNAQWQLVTTFNEWGEGTSVESAVQWASASGYGQYMDVLRNNGLSTTPTAGPTIGPATNTPVPPPATNTSVPPPATNPPPGATNTPVPPAATNTSMPPASPTSAAADPVIAAAGDIACDPSDGSYNGGNGTGSNCRQKYTSNLLVGANLAAVLTLGDNQYENGALSKYQTSYHASWGRVKSLTKPAVGNHEYGTSGASGYFSYFGAAAGAPGKGYYSYNIGAWHLIALNSNCSQVGGCGAGSPQETWLRADLAANPTACTLAYWHHPRFSSGQHGSDAAYTAFWQALYNAGADVVLSGHDHDYERFNPQTPGGAADANFGIQQFVVGTGGKNHYGFGSPKPNSAVRNSNTYGVLKLTLRANSYTWQFVAEAGQSFTDSGSRNCHGAPGGGNPTPTPLPGNTRTFVPTADTYTNADTPTTNYGSATQIRIDGSPVNRSYLKFEVQGLNGTVSRALLRIYANSSSGAGYQVYKLNDTGWTELGVTYNNAPALGQQLGAQGSFAGGQWTSVDVTALVTGNGTYAIALAGIDTTAVSLASRESANAPQLVITLP